MKDLDFLDKLWENTYDEVDMPVFIIERESDWENFNSKFGHKYMPHIFETVQLALREELLVVPVFKVLFVNTEKCITVICKRNNFDEALSRCIKYFEETEEFEKCQTALNMIENEG